MHLFLFQICLGIGAAMAADSDFIMPDEGLPHARTIMAWPGSNNPNYQEDGSLAEMKNELTAIAQAIADFEPVTLLVGSDQVSDAQRRFQNYSHYGVEIKAMNMDDLEPWMRDVAPTFVFSKESPSSLHGIDFNFNGWGGRYPSINNSQLARRFLNDHQIPRVTTSVVVEGGALETDGEGTVIATESSILNPNRNPDMSREAIEKEIYRLWGVSKIIWVPGVRDEDITDAHIDSLARFVAPGKVVLSRPTPDNKEWTTVYNEIKHILSEATDAKDRAFKIVDLPEADINDVNTTETDMVLGYVNYLLVNGAVIAPRFGSGKSDTKAKDILQTLFPEREVVQVYLNEIAVNGGGIHCMTQQIPSSNL
ncbi:hypothetical protein BDV27DRAFT_133212 [Aspergillus caelatus]|uniref:Agmatine deiminase n=1 Tax=Aspergillus caelatus TaxID=61420 RepID=A0A5N6ZUP0_9EURO|nr:uncharacterized protein BDV27DRAFT_133212 [Aspergillus caelatus]KAE8361331.1 hypothetical protein BDV27DRAFT_133212 [Aspergillus caelatus]